MYAISTEPLFRICRRESSMRNLRSLKSSSVEFSSFGYSLSKLVWHGRSFYNFRAVAPIAGLSGAAFLETSESTDVCFKKSFPLKRTEVEEGRIFIRLDSRKSEKLLQLTVGCNLPGKWILHWGVSFIDDVGSEWDQPPMEMRPPGSIPIKDYAIETPLRKSPSSFGGDAFYEVKIDFDPKIGIAAVNFVMKDEETGAWFQHKGRDFKVPLVNYVKDDGNVVGMKKGFDLWPGALGHLTSILRNTESPNSKDHDHESESNDPNLEISCLDGLSEELPIVKEKAFDNCISVTVTKCPDTAKNLIYMETDLPEGVVVHWGVCRNNTRKWEIPSSPHPPNTTMFKNKALRTLLQPKEKDKGCWGMFTLGEDLEAFLFVLKLNENWLNYNGNDFYIPLVGSGSLPDLKLQVQSDIIELSDKGGEYQEASSSASTDGIINEVRNLVSDISSEKSLKTKTKEARESILQEIEKDQEASGSASTDGIINEIRNLVSDISSEKSRKTKTNEARESILQEIEKLAAEAYSIFRTSIPTFPEEVLEESETVEAPVKICSGTGSGYEILCQGFNWESNKSGRWYMELKEKAAELSALGFTVVWLPPPTESVSPEGYMPKDLYNLNSRYGKIDELKDVVKTFHKLGMKVLGDAVLNHRCAHFQNKNGVWNIFGGQLNWDDRAVVCDDPHFQGRGNKSSGDSFHAAPNIDHSQEFVRKDIKEWLCWLRKEIGYDGWRLDFVRGFWGGYVKDYLDASQPYFSVGEFWDSLSYTYNAMDHNQDAHRQRIIDWINATNGTSGAFDVTTKGILHSALERCEYWRLSDSKGKPPGVVGWWPSRAVTFIENHDTGSTQGHWRFPGGKEMQGYAYILTHPGTPSVFYDHIFSHYKSEIASLISLRNRQKIHCRSEVKITKAERDVYAAIIDEKVAMKIGPGYYQPPSGSQQWSLAIEGNNYKVWESSS